MPPAVVPCHPASPRTRRLPVAAITAADGDSRRIVAQAEAPDAAERVVEKRRAIAGGAGGADRRVQCMPSARCTARARRCRTTPTSCSGARIASRQIEPHRARVAHGRVDDVGAGDDVERGRCPRDAVGRRRQAGSRAVAGHVPHLEQAVARIEEHAVAEHHRGRIGGVVRSRSRRHLPRPSRAAAPDWTGDRWRDETRCRVVSSIRKSSTNNCRPTSMGITAGGDARYGGSTGCSVDDTSAAAAMASQHDAVVEDLREEAATPRWATAAPWRRPPHRRETSFGKHRTSMAHTSSVADPTQARAALACRGHTRWLLLSMRGSCRRTLPASRRLCAITVSTVGRSRLPSTPFISRSALMQCP